MLINKEKLFSFTRHSGLYSVEESGDRVTITFSSVVLEELLGENTEIVVSGRVVGENVDIDRVFIGRAGVREEVDPKVLEGWLKYIESTERR
ncbi:hypothetical protein IG193_02525 [Infirmifilum lucidum]|uniref:Uncharacterized protein n=1 Tax=Infirmifilum lucidum TaxID=2776706 RepID=A0A7L9FKF5_9CREN|nr:hypothetical protein [Infirmifilum lucidum]QOJ79356.1 hypothetical protein IG193_02525 [Infirmifilum lucidum]